jgi:hypothetical protein
LEVLNFILSKYLDKVQGDRAREEYDRLQPGLAKIRERRPDLGILLVYFYTQAQPNPESPLVPPAIFGRIETATGLTRDEARADWLSRPHLRAALPKGKDEHTYEDWNPPAQPASVTSIRAPFPSVALATFAPGRSSLQDVSWGGATGFDDESTSTLRVPDGVQPRFLILQVPASLRWPAGGEHTTSIPIEERTSAEGGRIPVVNLDPIMPGNVSAACVFPADDATHDLFETAPATHDTLGQLDGYTNFKQARWVRPENIRLMQRR